jgi:hypothetical protein
VTIPPDVFEEVSVELSLVLQRSIDDNDSDEAVTLGRVQMVMEEGLLDALEKEGLLEMDPDRSIETEIGDLIEAYGEEALAVRFVRPEASEILGTVIESFADRNGTDQPPTLGMVRDAMHNGLVADMIGLGEIDDDEEQTLYDEMDHLVELHGNDAPAEDFVRFL